VIATRCCAVDELVEEILIEEGSVDQLAQALRRLIVDSDLRFNHGRRNREIVQEKYSYEKFDLFLQNLILYGKNS
jgi:glycosyltransferase involved in cell wall biosynthesis